MEGVTKLDKVRNDVIRQRLKYVGSIMEIARKAESMTSENTCDAVVVTRDQT